MVRCLVLSFAVLIAIAGSNGLAIEAESAAAIAERNCGQYACVLVSDLLGQPLTIENVTSSLGENPLSVFEIEEYLQKEGLGVSAVHVERGRFQQACRRLGQKLLGGRTVGIGLLGANEATIGHFMVFYRDGLGRVIAIDPSTFRSKVLASTAETDNMSMLYVTGYQSVFFRVANHWFVAPALLCTTLLAVAILFRMRRYQSIGRWYCVVASIPMIAGMILVVERSGLAFPSSDAFEKQFAKSDPSSTQIKQRFNSLDLGEHRVGQKVPFSFDIPNQDDFDMVVEKIWTSCSCVEVESKTGVVPIGGKYVLQGTMQLGSFGRFEQSVYVSIQNKANANESVVAWKLLGSALSGPKLVETRKTISIAGFDDSRVHTESFLIAAFIGDKPHRFDEVTWDRETSPFVSLRIENGMDGETYSRLFLEVKSEAPPETQIMVGLESKGPDGSDSAQLALKILNLSIASIVPQTAMIEQDGTVKVWLVAPSNNPLGRVFCKLFDDHGTELASTECGVNDHADGDSTRPTKVVTMVAPPSATSNGRILVARLFDGAERELGSFQVLVPHE
jgi:hypothetical protein